MELSPGSIGCRVYLGILLFKGGKLQEAESVLRDAVKLGGEIDEALANLGGVLLAQQRYEEAGECYRSALEIDHDYIFAKVRLLDVEHTLNFKKRFLR